MVSPEQQRLDLQLVWALEQLPELVAVMRERVTPTIVYGFSATGGASSGGMKDRLPVVVPVLDDLTQTWRLVTEFVTDFANHLHEQVDRSGTARVGGLRHVRLRPAESTPAEWAVAARSVLGWVRLRAWQIGSLPSGVPEGPREIVSGAAEVVIGRVVKMRARYLPRALPHWWNTRETCPVCLERAVAVTWVDKHLRVACARCGFDPVGSDPVVRARLEDMYLGFVREEHEIKGTDE